MKIRKTVVWAAAVAAGVTVGCAEFLDRSSVPGETKPWRTIAWESESTVGKRYNGWEWGALQPDELIVEIGPKTIQTVTSPLDNAKKK